MEESDETKVIRDLPVSAAGAVRLLRPSDSSGAVRQVAVPQVARRRTSLTRVDYADAFVVTTDEAETKTAERWARAMLEEARPETRRTLRRGWRSLGLGLGDERDPRRIAGWEVRQQSSAFVVLGADSPLGLRAEVLVELDRPGLLFSTLARFANPLMRAFWVAFAPVHRRAVHALLEQGIRREENRQRAPARDQD